MTLFVILILRFQSDFDFFDLLNTASERLLKKATELAYKQVREWGMSKAVGNLSFGVSLTI